MNKIFALMRAIEIRTTGSRNIMNWQNTIRRVNVVQNNAKRLQDLKYRMACMRLRARILTAVCIIGLFSAVFMGIGLAYSDSVVNGLSDSMLRFHVIANSDSPEDQALKLKVRDRIIEFMHQKLAASQNLDETKIIVEDSLRDIEKISQEVIASEGKQFSVHARLGDYDFPTKAYGDIALPAGKYQALRVEIGEAKGANWWCVLFPPLCFVDETHGTVPQASKEEMRKVLTAEEYGIVTGAKTDKEIPIRVRFKLVDFLEDSKIKVAGVFDNLLEHIR